MKKSKCSGWDHSRCAVPTCGIFFVALFVLRVRLLVDLLKGPPKYWRLLPSEVWVCGPCSIMLQRLVDKGFATTRAKALRKKFYGDRRVEWLDDLIANGAERANVALKERRPKERRLGSSDQLPKHTLRSLFKEFDSLAAAIDRAA